MPTNTSASYPPLGPLTGSLFGSPDSHVLVDGGHVPVEREAVHDGPARGGLVQAAQHRDCRRLPRAVVPLPQTEKKKKNIHTHTQTYTRARSKMLGSNIKMKN